MNDQSANNSEFGERTGNPRVIVPKSASEALRPEAGTPPPRRSRQSRNRFVVFLNFMMSLVILALIVTGVVFYFGKREFDGPGPLLTSSTVVIKPASSVRDIAELLDRRGMISNSRVFQIGVRAHGNDGQLKAGEYEIKARASMREIMETLKSGKSVLYSLTIPEGLTVFQALRRIAEHEELVGEMPAEVPREGWLVADTQRFARGTTRAEIIDKMVKDQVKLVDAIWSRRQPDLPLADINEFVTLASIVEKETGRADERTRVAGVFINRLRRGIRLQSDPTIIYGIFGGEGKPADRPIFRSDIDNPTPYNTYTIDGLPPTPIANPGRAALEAVANPSRTEDLYFVADGTGGHVFAKTLEEHNENVARWRRIEAERKAEAEKKAAEEAEASE
ncbi:MAG: endolytic transglycosylase MltG [Rhizobiaceae bacterium]